jgi:hypothetical protein
VRSSFVEASCQRSSAAFWALWARKLNTVVLCTWSPYQTVTSTTASSPRPPQTPPCRPARPEAGRPQVVVGPGSAWRVQRPLSSAGTVEMRSLLSGPDLASEDIFTFHAEHEERVRQMTADQTSMLAFLRNSIASPSSGERAVARRGWRWNRRVAWPRPGSRSRSCVTRGAWRASCRGLRHRHTQHR